MLIILVVVFLLKKHTKKRLFWVVNQIYFDFMQLVIFLNSIL